MKLTKSKGRWFKYEDTVEFKLHFSPEPAGDFIPYFKQICSDWKGIEGDDGKPLEYNDANIANLLISEEGQLAFAWMMTKTQNLMQFMDMDNLKKKLNGSAAGDSTSPQPAKATA